MPNIHAKKVPGKNARNNMPRPIAFALIIIPPIIALLFIAAYGVNVPYWDQWGAVVLLLGKFYGGTLAVGDLFNQFVVHRIPFPRIALLAIALLTGYNVLAQMYFSWILLAGALCLIYLAYKADFGNSNAALLGFIPISILLFSLAQQRNFLLGIQVCFYMCIAASVAALYFLRKCDRPVMFLLAVLSAIIASYSFLLGLNVWAVGLGMILLSKDRNRAFTAITWAACGAITGFTYLYGWVKPAHYPPLTFAIENPLTSIPYFIINIGAPLSPSSLEIAFLCGICILALAGFLIYTALKKGIGNHGPFWLALIAFTLIASLETTAGRSFFGVDQALTSRYTTTTSLAFIGLYAISYNLRKSGKAYSIAYSAFVAIILLGATYAFFDGIQKGEATKAEMERLVPILANYQMASDDELRELNPNPEKVREGARILEEHCMSVFPCNGK